MAENENEFPDLEALIAEENRDKSRENKEIRKRHGKEKRKKLLIFIPTGLVVVGLAVTLLVYNPFGSGSNGKAEPTATPTASTGTGTPVANGKQEWWQKDDNKFPVDVPKWTTKAAPTNHQELPERTDDDSDSEEESNNTSAQDKYEELLNDRFGRESDALQKLYEDSQRTYEGEALANAAVQLPSREGGYTDDVDKRELEDGSLNPVFSFWTREGFTGEVGVLFNRLLNPVFGDWQNASENGADQGAMDTLSDLFTSEWLNNNSPGNLPIVTTENAPISDVDYLPEGGVRWVGVIDPASESWNFVYDQELKGYSVTYSAKVTYSAWKQDKGVVSFDANLELHMIPNSLGQNTASGNRILIDKASLSF